MRMRFISGIAVIILLAGTAVADSITTFVDGTFADSNWTSVGAGTGLKSYSVGQLTAGGNPGSFRQVSINVNNGSGEVFNLQNTFTYNPLTQGAIGSVSGTYDLINSGSVAVGYGIILFQNGSYYSTGAGTSATSSSWTSGSDAGIFTLLFGNGALHPDFSATGGVIDFGYLAENFAATNTSFTSQSGIDNLTITVTPAAQVPEPTSLLLFGAGAIAMAAKRRLWHQLISLDRKP